MKNTKSNNHMHVTLLFISMTITPLCFTINHDVGSGHIYTDVYNSIH